MIKFLKQNWWLIFTVIYIFSPFDFIPEFIAGPIGFLDDGALVLTTLVIAFYNQVIKKDSAEEEEASAEKQIRLTPN